MTSARPGIHFAALLVIALLATVILGLVTPPTAAAQNEPPDAPANLRVEFTDDGSRLTWDDPDDASITLYEFRLRLVGESRWRNDWTEVPGSSATTTSITYLNLSDGLPVYTEIRARNTHGPGDAANLTFTTPGGRADPPDPPDPPSPPSSSTSSSSSSSGSSSPSPPAPAPPPAPTPQPTVVGATPSATATEVPDNRLHLQRHDDPDASLQLPIGAISADCATVVMAGVIRDQTLGQTYVVVRRESDGQIVRRWVSPVSPLVYQIPWPIVNSQYTVPVGVVAAIPLDDQCPQPNLLARRFDGGDDRIFGYDANLQRWRHVPDIPTFQALGFYWCNVTVADAAFFARITPGPAHPPSEIPTRADYPNCLTG